MSEEKKVKQTTVRFYEEDLEKIGSLAKELGVSQAELVNEWKKSYERLQLESTSSQGENLKTLRSYMDKIDTLFQAMDQATTEKVQSKEDEAIKFRKLYQDLAIESKEDKEKFATQIKEKDDVITGLNKELKKAKDFEDSVEDRITDKDSIIASRDKDIQSLAVEVTSLKNDLKAYANVEAEKQALRDEIKELKDTAEKTRNEHERALTTRERELHREYSGKIEAIYIKLAEQIEETRIKAKQEAEANAKDKYELLIADLQNKLKAAEKSEKQLSDLLEGERKKNAELTEENKGLRSDLQITKKEDQR